MATMTILDDPRNFSLTSRIQAVETPLSSSR
jgi:hypothetical protein